MSIGAKQIRQLTVALIANPPGVNDDALQNYMVGSTVYSISDQTFYECSDNTPGAAVWGAVSMGGSPGGSDTQVQFNDSGAFGGDSGLTYNKTTDVLTSTGGYVDSSATASKALIVNSGKKITSSPTTDTQLAYLQGILTPAIGDMFYFDGTNIVKLAAGTSGEYIISGGAAAPTFAKAIPIIDAGGTVDAITATFSPAITLADNTLCAVVLSGVNTISNPTFNPNGLGAGTIVKGANQALEYGDLPGSEAVAIFRYDLGNTRWELLNPAKGALRGTIRISGNVTTTSDTASDITGFTLAVAANSEYCIELNLRIGCNNTGGVKMRWNLPTGATIEGPLIGSTTGVTAQSMFSVLVSTQTLGTTQYNTTNSATGAIVQRLKLVTAGTSGTLAFQFASTTSGQTSTIYGTGSYMRWEKVQ